MALGASSAMALGASSAMALGASSATAFGVCAEVGADACSGGWLLCMAGLFCNRLVWRGVSRSGD